MQLFKSIPNFIDIKLKESFNYSLSLTNITNEGLLRTYVVERNNIWQKEIKEFLNFNNSKTNSGTINNNFYKYKFKYDVIIPYNIYEIIINYYIESKKINIKESKFIEKYLDHLIMFCQAINYYNGKYISYCHSKKDKTPIYVKLIYSLIGRDYKKILSLLIKMGILEIDMSYLPAYLDKKSNTDKKGICRHYSFIPKLSEEFIVYQITNRIIVTKSYNSNNIQEVDYLNNSKNIVKDKEINSYFSNNFSLSEETEEYRHLDYSGYSLYFQKISNEGDKFKNLSIGRDKFGHRLYHPFCYMKSNLRKYIKINGSTDNIKIDINNSHPYFFSMLFDNNFLKYIKHLLTEEEINLFKSIINNPLFEEKIKIFKQITSSGSYYNFLKENIQTDKDIKIMNMYYFYGKFNKRNQLYKFFDKNFNFINIVKHNIIKMGGYKRLCQILQRIESYFIIDGVFNKLKNMGINVIPLHDCIMGSKKDEFIIRKTIIDEFIKSKVEFIPKFDKNIKTEQIIKQFDKIKQDNGSLFLNKGIILEELNIIIKSIGIKNRIFKEDMKIKNQIYIDTKFEDNRHLIDDEIANKYYELRIKLDLEQFDIIDYKEIFEKYKNSNMKKKKWYSNNITDYVKINPIEFYNYLYDKKYKTRIKENNYIY